jgi:hypothetical protein
MNLNKDKEVVPAVKSIPL